MKRSESVLVYAVTAVLAVILVVAVVFGNDGAVSAHPSEGGETGTVDDLQEVLGGSGPVVVGGGELRGPTEPGPGTVEEPGDDGVLSVPMGPLRANGNVVTLASALGSFRAENQADGTRYRVVDVKRGDTFSNLVLSWTADPGTAPMVLALNEWVDPATRQLAAGDELWFPWVDDSELLAAWQRRGESGPRPVRDTAAPAGPVGDDPVSSSPPVAGETHVVQKGESLWAIAEKKVGRRATPAYIDAIVAANPSVKSRDAVRAGQRIVLPAVQ